jgi:hypothetical protein
MNAARINLFLAWLLMVEVVAMGWVAFVGRMLLEALGVSTAEGSIPGHLVGLILLFGGILSIQVWRGGLAPQGNPGGKGYRFGSRLVLAANVLAALLLGFEFTKHWVADPMLSGVIAKFTDAFGYWVLAMWAIGFSFLYQSSLPVSASK